MSAVGFTPIQLYRSTTASAVPTSGNLADGELAINTNDGKLYYKDSGGAVQLIASKAGASGDVVGPASATDNAVVRFDGTSGKLVQNSVVTIADSTGDVAGVGALTASGNLTLSGGTANGVLYLNGSKVATSGSAVTYNGTTFATSADASISGLTVGKGAGAVATNTAVGASALAANTSGQFNTAIGFTATQSNQTGNQNTSVGYGAGKAATAGNITAVGVFAAQATTTGVNNDAFGINALYTNTTGSYNTAVGDSALFSNTTASNNTAVGYQAAYTSTTGTGNAVLGLQAFFNNTTGNYNTAVGYQSLFSNTTADQNAAFGYEALRANTTGAYNSASGFRALYSNTTGSANVAQGFDALRSNTTASNNTAVGYQAAYSNTTGTRVVAVGQSALYGNTTGNYLVAVGRGAGYSNQTGQQATFIGDNAGYSSTAGGNTFIGTASGYNVTTGTKNTFVGGGDVATIYPSGYFVTTGSANTIIGNYNGNQGGLDIRTASNYIVLSDGDGNPRGIYNNNGQYMVGTVAPIYSNADLVHFYGRVSGGNQFGLMVGGDASLYTCYGARFLTNNSGNVVGSITFTTTATAYNTSSDYRLKDNPQPLTGSGAFIDALQPKTWTWKTDGTKGVGFIAHEVQEVSPSSVTGEKDAVDENGNPEHQAMEYGSAEFIANIIAELQSLRKRVAELEAK